MGQQQRERILIVDNDDAVLVALQQVLEDQGYETETCWDLEQAQKLMNSVPIDVLLVGDHPPDLNCERLLKHLRNSQSWIPCVIMHGAARHPFSVEYLQHLGAHGVACKWNYNEVLQEVKNCLADYHAVA